MMRRMSRTREKLVMAVNESCNKYDESKHNYSKASELAMHAGKECDRAWLNKLKTEQELKEYDEAKK